MRIDESPTADRVLELLGGRPPGEWEVFGEWRVHHELHYIGRRIEMRRGPIELEGYSVRRFVPREGETGVGVASSNELTPAGAARAFETAGSAAGLSVFPAPKVTLDPLGAPAPSVEAVDAAIRDDPIRALEDFGLGLLNQYPAGGTVRPSFGSVRITYGIASISNSAGGSVAFPSTFAEFEWATQSSGGPEGRAPGEHWVNSSAPRLDPATLGVDVPGWSRLAADARRARSPPTGSLRVLYPPRVLEDILLPVLSFRLSGAARLLQMAPALGDALGSPLVQLRDDPHLPWGLRTAPYDDEGIPTRPRDLLAEGRVRSLAYDRLHGAAAGEPLTGSGYRGGVDAFTNWFRFTQGVAPSTGNLVLAPGDGGSIDELLATMGDGILLSQLGYAFPDPVSGSYGGEIRLGYRIEGGKLKEPVRGGTVGGLVVGPPGTPSLLSGIIGLGSKPALVGALSVPHVLVEGVGVAGAT